MEWAFEVLDFAVLECALRVALCVEDLACVLCVALVAFLLGCAALLVEGARVVFTAAVLADDAAVVVLAALTVFAVAACTGPSPNPPRNTAETASAMSLDTIFIELSLYLSGKCPVIKDDLGGRTNFI